MDSSHLDQTKFMVSSMDVEGEWEMSTMTLGLYISLLIQQMCMVSGYFLDTKGTVKNNIDKMYTLDFILE